MTFCAICQSVDFRSLLCACLLQCQEAQRAYYGDGDESLPKHKRSLRPEKHDDIFHVKETAKEGCGLCKIIVQGFKQRNVKNEEDARGLRIGFCTFENKIEVCYDSEEGPIRLCGLDVYMSEATVVECFRVFKIKEDDSPPVLRMMEKNPGSQACLAVASNWLRDCSENHARCNPLTESQNKPKRLIDIGDGSREPSLVDTETLPESIKWLSLSYCWGEEPSLKLTRDTIGMLRSGIAMDKLDRTIQDAIYVTRALGIPYIWIDALCIMQDPEGAEWREQASKMDEIYVGSTVTLVVASSKTVTEGFLKDRQPQYIPTPLLKVYLSLEWDKNEDYGDGPWSKRGWTMQEGLLPNKLLYYTSSQMIWKCCQEERFERGVRKNVNSLVDKYIHGLPDHDISFGSPWIWELEMFLKFKQFRSYLPLSLGPSWFSDPNIFRLWYELIEEYSSRQFKDIGDRLVALSGLAKVYGSTIKCDGYVAGLWMPDLIRGLMWRTEGANLTRTANNTLPSWSWASIGYESIKVGQVTQHVQCLSQVQEVHIDLVDRCQPFGMVRSGSITIAGPLKKFPILYNKAWRSTDESMTRLERYISEKLEEESSGDVSPRYSSPLGGHFAVLQMLYDVDSLGLLVLEATGGVTDGFYTYWRVGTLSLLDYHEEDQTPPDTMAKLDWILRDCLTARLGPQPKWSQGSKCVFGLVAEIMGDHWDIQTITLV
ncbi:heterokaryon incompatibility protein-domain-containing protein [Nemania abortiva]|nr:heterokaryon incompatibility protein-domain-containing protein [Nemania abortiva]